MAQVRLKTQVWREGDPPLTNGNPPAQPQPDAPRTSPRPLLWAGVLCCIVAGAWLCGLLWRWQTPGTPLCAGAWVLLCLGAIVVAWRRTR